MRAVYTTEQKEFFSAYAPGHSRKEITETVNEKFGLSLSEKQIGSYLDNHKIRTGRDEKYKTGKLPVNRLLTPEQEAYVAQYAPGHSRKEITEAVNEKFGLELKVEQMAGWMKRHKVSTQRTGWIEKGSIPANKLPVGTEVYNPLTGYTRVKVAEPGIWQDKQRVIWQAHYGEIPKGKIVIFLDGNPENCVIDNLQLIDRKCNMIMNRFGLHQDNPDLTMAGIATAELIAKITEKSKG